MQRFLTFLLRVHTGMLAYGMYTISIITIIVKAFKLMALAP